MKVGVLADYQDVAARCADWSRLGPGVQIEFIHEHLGSEAQVVERLQSFDVLVAMRERTPFPASTIRQLKNLKLLVTTAMRNAAIDLSACAAAGIPVCGTGSYPLMAAELAWALIMALFKQVPHNDQAVRAGRWQTSLGASLDGAVLGLIGLGKLGAEVGRVGRAFGMDVLAWSPNLTPERCAEHDVRYASKAELFARADVISVHMVLSSTTQGIVSAADLAAMKSSAYLVNTSRGRLVDEAALCEALHSGAIAGAALDVFEREPLPPDAEILRAPNTVLTPHVGYATWQNYRKYYSDAVEDIIAWQAGSCVRVLA